MKGRKLIDVDLRKSAQGRINQLNEDTIEASEERIAQRGMGWFARMKTDLGKFMVQR